MMTCCHCKVDCIFPQISELGVIQLSVTLRGRGEGVRFGLFQHYEYVWYNIINLHFEGVGEGQNYFPDKMLRNT